MIFLSNSLSPSDADMLQHEYGHTQQLDQLGIVVYTNTVVTPSVISYHLSECIPFLDDNYFNLPWEYKADDMGGTAHTTQRWAKKLSDLYWSASKIVSGVYKYFTGVR